MKFKLILLGLIFLVLMAVSSITFEITRIKITIFELLMPWLFLAWLHRNIRSKFVGLSSPPLIVLVFLSLFFLSGIWLYFRNSYYISYYEDLLLNMLLFAFFLVLLESKPSSQEMHATLFIASLFIFLYGVLQIFKLDPFNWGSEFLQEGRIYSTFANPNNLALFSNLIIFLALYYLLEKGKKYPLFILALAGLNFIFSKSGSGTLGLLFGFMVLAFGYRKRIRLLLLSGLVLTVAILGVWLPNLKPDSLLYRLSIWKSTFQIIKARPIFGWGLKSFQHIYPEFIDPKIYLLVKDHQIEFLHPDNYYLDLLVEGGIFYLFLFLFANFILFYHLSKWKQNPICRYYLAGLVSMLVPNLFSESFGSFAPFFLYVLVFALSLKEYIKEPLQGKISLGIKFYRTVFCLFLISNTLVLYFSLRIFASQLYLKKAIYSSQLKQFQEAENYYLKSIEFDYFNPLAHYLLANLYQEKGGEDDLYSALRFYNNAEFLAGNYLQLYFFKGLVYYKLNDRRWADYYLNKAFQTDPYLYYQFSYSLKYSG